MTGAFPMYQIHETVTVMPSDTLLVDGPLIIQVDPGMNIALEILGTLNGDMGMGTLFHSGGREHGAGFGCTVPARFG